MVIDLRCHNVVVIGGGSGIGFEIAKKLIENGCCVCIASRSLEKLKKAQEKINSDKLSVLEFDVTDVDNIIPRLNDAACLLGGYYDGIVNAAGVYTARNNWVVSSGEWDNVIDTNLKAAVFIMQKAVACMRDNNVKGNILQIASVVGSHGTEMHSAYFISKNSLVNTTSAMGKQAAHLGIVINGVAPGVTYTQMSSNKEVAQRQMAIGRIIEPKEIADIAMFMLSEQAKICIGETIIADGGFMGSW